MDTMETARTVRACNYCWDIPQTGDMRVPGRVFADEDLLKLAQRDSTLSQVRNVAHLPGIIRCSLAMPDMHWGYGFPIGGVAATDPDNGGVISPGGIGYDINCGVRLIRSNLAHEEILNRLHLLVQTLFKTIPCGVGARSSLHLSWSELKAALRGGSQWAVAEGYGINEDVELCENRGTMSEANPAKVSDRALKRGCDQLGTLGSGNHFLEIDTVEEVYDQEAAQTLGLFSGQVVVMIHSGSRGLGYQVCDEYIVAMRAAVKKYNIPLPDRQLSCAPFASREGQDYFAAMAAAANFAWANRQLITHQTRKVFRQVLNAGKQELGLSLVYDVCHNIGKLENHRIGNHYKKVLVHRKGATRAFPPGHPDTPARYKKCGQPVLIPGDMGTHSYVLVGQEQSMCETWGSTCHGAGRVLSRTAAKKKAHGRAIEHELSSAGILVLARRRETLAEEMPAAYKDINQVVNVVEQTGLSRRVARLRPLAVIKG